MTARLNLIGQRFGLLTVLRFAGTDKLYQGLWLVRCDCGHEKVITTGRLRGCPSKPGAKRCGVYGRHRIAYPSRRYWRFTCADCGGPKQFKRSARCRRCHLDPARQRSRYVGIFHQCYKVNQTTNCWEWTRGRHSQGYGVIKWGKRMMGAHRVSWEIHHGPIPNGLHVCHKCDNRPCVNPDHLFLGTQQDNWSDCVAKHRNARGHQVNKGKLHAEQVRAIRVDNRKQKDIARDYGVDPSSISFIKSGRSWGWLS